METRTAPATYAAAIATEPKQWLVLATASAANLCGRSSMSTGCHALRHCVNVDQVRPNRLFVIQQQLIMLGNAAASVKSRRCMRKIIYFATRAHQIASKLHLSKDNVTHSAQKRCRAVLPGNDV